jgi:hypothetical protein
MISANTIGIINDDIPNELKLKGVSYIGSGINLINAKLSGRRVIKYTYNDKNEYDDQLHERSYLYPDQLVVIEGTSGKVITDVFTQWQSYSKKMSTKVGADAGLGWFSGSITSEKMKRTMQNTSKTISETTEHIALYRIRTDSLRFLEQSHTLEKYVSVLMKDYNYNNCLELVDQIGTHWITEAEFGGTAGMSTVIGEKYTEKENVEKTAAQAGIEFSWVKIHGEYQKECHELTKNYRENRHYVTYTNGGDPASLKDFDKWAKTVYKSPIAISYKVRRITDLISDPLLKANTNKCIIEYAMKHPVHVPVKKYKKCYLQKYYVGNLPQYLEELTGNFLNALGANHRRAPGNGCQAGFTNLLNFQYNKNKFYNVKEAGLGQYGKCWHTDRCVCDGKSTGWRWDNLIDWVTGHVHGDVCCNVIYE